MNAYALYGRRKADGYHEGGFEWEWILSGRYRLSVIGAKQDMSRQFKNCEFEVRDEER